MKGMIEREGKENDMKTKNGKRRTSAILSLVNWLVCQSWCFQAAICNE